LKRGVVHIAALVSILGPGCLSAQHPATGGALSERYRADANKLIVAALADSSAWNRLATLTDTYGHRLSGSASLESAIDWILAEMKRDGLENVRGEPVMVPHWVRGEESAYLVSPRPYR
jgi:carboxypeptidase Q